MLILPVWAVLVWNLDQFREPYSYVGKRPVHVHDIGVPLKNAILWLFERDLAEIANEALWSLRVTSVFVRCHLVPRRI
jgi:hypothetical protein